MGYKLSEYNMFIDKNEQFKYLYNSFSGSLCKLEIDKVDALSNLEEFEKNENEIFTTMIKQGYIVPDTLNETNRIIMNHNVATMNLYPEKLAFIIAPTMKCNLSCIYCFEANSVKNNGFDEVVCNDVFEYIKNKVIKNKNLKYLTIDWFGGEPMLKYDLIVEFSQKLIKLCEGHNVKYSACMLSNGVLLTKEKAKVLKEVCKVNSIQIPLDGTKERYCQFKRTNGETFDKVLQNVVDASDILDLHIRLNTNRNNYDDIKALTKHLLVDLKLGSKVKLYIAELKYFEGYTNFEKTSCYENENFTKIKLEFIDYVRNELGISDFKYAHQKPKRVSCGLCKYNNMVIGPNGELYKCEHHVGREDLVVGSCKEGRYYTDTEMNFVSTEIKDRCKKCKLLPLCYGGCRNESIIGKDYDAFCRSMQIDVEEILKLKISDYENKIDSMYGKRR